MTFKDLFYLSSYSVFLPSGHGIFFLCLQAWMGQPLKILSVSFLTFPSWTAPGTWQDCYRRYPIFPVLGALKVSRSAGILEFWFVVGHVTLSIFNWYNVSCKGKISQNAKITSKIIMDGTQDVDSKTWQ